VETQGFDGDLPEFEGGDQEAADFEDAEDEDEGIYSSNKRTREDDEGDDELVSVD
jgi:hypothetical protein